MDLLGHLVRSPTRPRQPISTLAAWLARLDDAPPWTSVDRAAWAGFEADRLGYAFAGGYHAALGRLVGGTARRISLAATEARGGHPRAIETRLEPADGGFLLRGVKTFATLASVAEEILVVASKGTAVDGKNALALVRVRAGAANMVLEDRPPTPFAPEIPHAKITLDGVFVADADVLPGDGYTSYLKPFRTVEDVHVLAATLGFVVWAARAHAGGKRSYSSERALALVAALQTIGARDPSDPHTHLALAGAFASARAVIDALDAEWTTQDEVRERWTRDLPLLGVADVVRQKRTEVAWTATSTAATRQE
jgi:alkylation response protein AidB-like acyl-CoA dehydrogenase